MLKSVLIANRGVVALRVIRACRDLGIKSVLAVSTADRGSLPAKLADETVCVGGPRPSESYLRLGAILAAAGGARVDGLHPGYGFLSEDSRLARGCSEMGIQFVGPSPEILDRSGDKAQAREVAEMAGVPILPGQRLPAGPVSPDLADELSNSIRYPLLIKAVHGGGGRGMRLVETSTELPAAAAAAAAEAEAAFGNGALYVERFIPAGRHIEVQIIGIPGSEPIHLWDRDCSVQRRHQKLIEEGPAFTLQLNVRSAMQEAAIALARALDYVNVGTVEFIVDAGTQEFYFLEINARLQVEHGVTELITGVDLVRTQLLIAGGEGDVQIPSLSGTRGHAIECRINAEDPAAKFLPSPGTITRWAPPVMGGVRFDSHCYAGYLVTPYYDSLVAKVIAFGEDRPDAIDTLARALRNLGIDGIKTTASWALSLIESEDFTEARIHTRWIDESQMSESIGH